VPPAIIELGRACDLKEEVFGPVLHVVRWRADDLARRLDDIAANACGLTRGIHARIEAPIENIATRLTVGNVYVNCKILGAWWEPSHGGPAFRALVRDAGGRMICVVRAGTHGHDQYGGGWKRQPAIRGRLTAGPISVTLELAPAPSLTAERAGLRFTSKIPDARGSQQK
jgi:hypothetical protein